MFAFDYTCVQDVTANLQLITHLLKPFFLTDIVPPKGVGRRTVWREGEAVCCAGLQAAAERKNLIQNPNGCSFACFLLHVERTLFSCLFSMRQR